VTAAAIQTPIAPIAKIMAKKFQITLISSIIVRPGNSLKKDSSRMLASFPHFGH
jgi:hypothetical protein